MTNDGGSAGQFKPNIYPIIYWGLVFGVCAGLLMFAMFLLSQFVNFIWFPVFLAGLLWGGYRNYQQQKRTWQQNAGGVVVGPPLEEIKAAAREIVAATREMMRERTAPGEGETSASPREDEAPPAPPAATPGPLT